MDLIQQAEKELRQLLLAAAQAAGYSLTVADIALETPQHCTNGDYSSNAAFVIAQRTRQPAAVVAKGIVSRLTAPTDLVERCWAADNGFINFTLKYDWFGPVVEQIQQDGAVYDRTYCGKHYSQILLVVDRPPLAASQLRAAAAALALTNAERALGTETEFVLVSRHGSAIVPLLFNLDIQVDRMITPEQLVVYDSCCLGHSRGVLIGTDSDIAALPGCLQFPHLRVQSVIVKGALCPEQEILQHIGPDALRYHLLRQRANAQMVLNAELAAAQHRRNPFYDLLYLAAGLVGCHAPSPSRLYYLLAQSPAVIKQAVHHLQPSKITAYLEELALLTGTAKAAQRINCSQRETMLLAATGEVLRYMLQLLGCMVPEQM